MLIRSGNRQALVAAALFVSVQAASWSLTERSAAAQAQPGDAPKTVDAPARRSAEPARAADLKEDASSGGATANGKAAPKSGEPEDVEAAKAVFFAGDVGFTRGQLGVAPHQLGLDKTGANGELYGLLAGFRMNAVRLGLRWRVHDTTEYTLWTFAASAGYALSMRPVTPIFSLHLGYVFDERVQAGLFRASIPPGNVVTPDVTLHGIIGGIDVAAEYWVTKAVRLGGFIGADAMFLFRPKVDTPQSLFGPTPDFDKLPLYSESGTTLGLNLNIGVRGEFDIALH